MALCIHSKLENQCFICNEGIVEQLMARVDALEKRLNDYINAPPVIPVEQMKFGNYRGKTIQDINSF